MQSFTLPKSCNKAELDKYVRTSIRQDREIGEGPDQEGWHGIDLCNLDEGVLDGVRFLYARRAGKKFEFAVTKSCFV